MHPVAGAPAARTSIAESVPRVATPAHREYTRRSVVLSAHLLASLTPSELRVIEDLATSPEYRHVPTGTPAVLAQRLGTVWASASTWYRLVRRCAWRRPRLRVHPVRPKIGLRTTRPNEMWHIETTVIRLLDGTRAYLHACDRFFHSLDIDHHRCSAPCAGLYGAAVLELHDHVLNPGIRFTGANVSATR